MLFTTIKPMLLTMHPEPFDSPAHIFEPKLDGARVLIHKSGDRIEAYTRNGMRITDRFFPELQQAVSAIRADSAILDCEGICLRDGRPVFDDFMFRFHLRQPRRIQSAAVTHPCTFVAFDVLYRNGKNVTSLSLMERKAILADIISPAPELSTTMFVEGHGKTLFEEMKRRNWEGIVAKRKDSVYRINLRSGQSIRSNVWQKVKFFKEIDTVILGYRREPTFGLVVGLHFPTVVNKPVATVEFGFKPDEKKAFLQVARQIHTVKDKNIQWIQPLLCCRIQYLEQTERHQLRIVSFKRFLPGMNPEDCKWVS